MFCGNCGTRNLDVNKYCRECGAKLPGTISPPPAEDQQDTAITVKPPSIDNAKVSMLMDVAFSYHRDGKLEQAIDTCLQAIAVDPDCATTHSFLALLYEERGQFDEAVIHLRLALQINPSSIVDQENLARLLGEEPSKPISEPIRLGRVTRPAGPVLAGAIAGVVVLVLLSSASFIMLGLKRSMSTQGEHPQGAQTQTEQRPEAFLAPPNNMPPTGSQPQTQSGTVAQQTETPAVEQPPAAMPEQTEPRAPRPAPPMRTPVRPPMQAVAEEPIEALPAPQKPPQQQQPEQPRVIFVPSMRAANRVVTTPATGAVPEPGVPSGSASVTISPTVRDSGSPTPGSRLIEPRAVVRVSEASPRDYKRWGLQSISRGDYDTAVKQLHKALDGAQSARERGELHQQMAYAYQQLGRNTESHAEYQQAITQYQEQLRQGMSPDLARASIRACQYGLQMLGM